MRQAVIMHEQECWRKIHLLETYRRAMLEFVNSLTELQGNTQRMATADSDTVYKRLEFLKATADKAKREYDSHVREHGC